MIHIDKDALECDLAETYRIYDMYGLPCSKVALFSCGLREDSRIKMKINNQNVSLSQTLLASIVDRLSLLCWLNSDDGRTGKNRPKSLLDALQGNVEEKRKRFRCI